LSALAHELLEALSAERIRRIELERSLESGECFVFLTQPRETNPSQLRKVRGGFWRRRQRRLGLEDVTELAPAARVLEERRELFVNLTRRAERLYDEVPSFDRRVSADAISGPELGAAESERTRLGRIGRAQRAHLERRREPIQIAGLLVQVLEPRERLFRARRIEQGAPAGDGAQIVFAETAQREPPLGRFLLRGGFRLLLDQYLERRPEHARVFSVTTQRDEPTSRRERRFVGDLLDDGGQERRARFRKLSFLQVEQSESVPDARPRLRAFGARARGRQEADGFFQLLRGCGRVHESREQLGVAEFRNHEGREQLHGPGRISEFLSTQEGEPATHAIESLGLRNRQLHDEHGRFALVLLEPGVRVRQLLGDARRDRPALQQSHGGFQHRARDRVSLQKLFDVYGCSERIAELVEVQSGKARLEGRCFVCRRRGVAAQLSFEETDEGFRVFFSFLRKRLVACHSVPVVSVAATGAPAWPSVLRREEVFVFPRRTEKCLVRARRRGMAGGKKAHEEQRRIPGRRSHPDVQRRGSRRGERRRCVHGRCHSRGGFCGRGRRRDRSGGRRRR
jgi:hypothetical protein